MKLLFDTSVLVAALVTGHAHHSFARPWLTCVLDHRHQGALCTHTLAELYATLTVLPIRPLPSPIEVQELLRRTIVAHFQAVDLDAADYQTALEITSASLLRSGAIFDALIEVAARKWSAAHVVTLNRNHFLRLSPIPGRILDPLQDPVPQAT